MMNLEQITEKLAMLVSKCPSGTIVVDGVDVGQCARELLMIAVEMQDER